MTDQAQRMEPTSDDWAPGDLGIGMLFLSLGVSYAWVFVQLLDFEAPLVGVLLIVLGGAGWLVIPLMIFLGGNAIYQSLAALVRRWRTTTSS